MTPGSPSSPERRPASAVPSITAVRFMPQDTEARLINISSTGLLAESMGRMGVGTSLEVIFEGGFTPRSAMGRVARCEVAVMGTDALLRYHIAIEFDTPIAFADEAASQTPAQLEPQRGAAAASAARSEKPRNRW
jgi:PilZ domain-containing protein